MGERGMIWTPCDKKNPDKEGTYMVTTAHGAIRFDRFVDGKWGLCNPQCRGRYKPHKAWAYMPKPYTN